MDYLKIRELYHSGIKGQKWGIRRYQNEDGTLTDAGKARYSKEGKKITDPTKLSDKELNDINRRLGAESQYRQLTGTTQPGRGFNRDAAVKIGATFVATAAATFLYRKMKTGNWLSTPSHTVGKNGAMSIKGVQGWKTATEGKKTLKKMAVGSAAVTAMVAGGIGALTAGATSLGGQVMSTKQN